MITIKFGFKPYPPVYMHTPDDRAYMETHPDIISTFSASRTTDCMPPRGAGCWPLQLVGVQAMLGLAALVSGWEPSQTVAALSASDGIVVCMRFSMTVRSSCMKRKRRNYISLSE
jgi:hypothetical protein